MSLCSFTVTVRRSFAYKLIVAEFRLACLGKPSKPVLEKIGTQNSSMHWNNEYSTVLQIHGTPLFGLTATWFVTLKTLLYIEAEGSYDMVLNLSGYSKTTWCFAQSTSKSRPESIRENLLHIW